MNIITVFAGRRENIEIQKRYLIKALELKLIDAVHYWNYTRNNEDCEYLKSISNLKRVSYNYIQIRPKLVNKSSFILRTNSSNTLYIILKNAINNYEIAIDIINKRISIFKNSTPFMETPINANWFKNTWNRFRIWSINKSIKINNGKKVYLHVNIGENIPLKDIHVKGSENTISEIMFNPVNNNGFFFMDKGKEPYWSEYYKYYSHNTFTNATIIKCDDDIVYIDLERLPDFLSYVKKTDKLMVYANTINNGVSAYYQQLNGLIPKQLGDFEYPNKGRCGTLWGSASKATALHKFFISNIDNFIKHTSEKKTVAIKHRYSINFFAMTGKNWQVVKNFGNGDDEGFIEKLKNRVLYEEFFVSHLSFFRQVDNGIDLSMLRGLYTDLATKNGL
jgi:hypothetical protein